jgi:hypothetical protein
MKNVISTILVLCGLFISINGNAQDEYSTTNGLIEISFPYSGTLLSYTSRDLVLVLDYEDATFQMQLDPTFLQSDEGEFLTDIAEFNATRFEMKGELGVEYINTTGHPPLDFDIEGISSTTGQTVYGTGYLKHLSNRGKFSCVLTLTFSMTVADLGVEIQGVDPTEIIHVEVIQVILNRIADQ